jgi:thiol:disulfide interchange protein DsbC
MSKIFWLSLLLLSGISLLAMSAGAFQQGGCGDGECRSCHNLSKKEAAALLSIGERKIIDLKIAEVPGLWEIDIRPRKKVFPVFIDFSKQYLFSGSLIKIADKQNITRERIINLNRVDVSRIPVDDALVVGRPDAKTKIIVFDDPQCPYCAKLQGEMKRVVEQRPDIAFLIKMFPLKIHPGSYAQAKAIVCAKSLPMLEDSFMGKILEMPGCETDRIEKNIALAAKLGIHSTPTLVFPDGRVIAGYRTAKDIIRLLGKAALKNK